MDVDICCRITGAEGKSNGSVDFCFVQALLRYMDSEQAINVCS